MLSTVTNLRGRGVTGQVNFSSHMDAVVSVAVGLVNALTSGEAHGRTFVPPAGAGLAPAVTAVLRSERPATRPVTLDEAAGFAMAAGALRAVFDAVAESRLDEAAREVNALLAFTGARPMLDKHDGEPWHLHFHGADDSLVTGWVAGCGTGLAGVLGREVDRR